MLVATWAVVTLVIWKQLFFLAGILDMVRKPGGRRGTPASPRFCRKPGRGRARAPKDKVRVRAGVWGPPLGESREDLNAGRSLRHPPPRFLLCRSLQLSPLLTRAAAPPSFSPPAAAAPQFNPLSGGESVIPGAGRLLPPQVSRPPWSVQRGAPRGQQALAGGGNERATGRRRRQREGRCCPARAPQAGAGVSAGAGAFWSSQGSRAGGKASARASGPPSPALAGAQPQGHADCLWRKPAPGEGEKRRLSPPLRGEPPPRAAAVLASPRGSWESEGRRPTGWRAEALSLWGSNGNFFGSSSVHRVRRPWRNWNSNCWSGGCSSLPSAKMGLKWPRQGCWEEQQPRCRRRCRLKCRRCRSHRQRRSRRRSVTHRRRDVTAPPPPVSCSFAWRIEGGQWAWPKVRKRGAVFLF